MKNLKTNEIAAGVKYPFHKESVEYLYLSNKELMNALSQTIGGALDGTSAYILYGMVKVDLGGDDFSFSKGAVYDSATEEIYFFDAVASIEILIDPILTITESFPVAYNPVKFSDLTFKSPHQEKKIVVSDAALGSGSINFEDLVDNRFETNDWVTYDGIDADLSANVGTWTLGAGSLEVRYLKNRGSVTLSFNAHNTFQTDPSIAYFEIELPAEIGVPTLECYGAGSFQNITDPNQDSGSTQGTFGTLITARTDGKIRIDALHNKNFFCGAVPDVDELRFKGSVTFPIV